MFFMAVVGSELSNTLRGPLAPLQEAELLSALRTATEICEPLQGAAEEAAKTPEFSPEFSLENLLFRPVSGHESPPKAREIMRKR